MPEDHIMAEEKKYTAEDVQNIKNQIDTLQQELAKAEACVRAEGLGGLQETLDKLLINKVVMSVKPAPDGECMAMFVRSVEPEMVDSIHRRAVLRGTSILIRQDKCSIDDLAIYLYTDTKGNPEHTVIGFDEPKDGELVEYRIVPRLSVTDPKGQGRKILADALELRNKAHAKDGKMSVSKFVSNINSYIRFDKKIGKMDPEFTRELEELADEMTGDNG
jgi:hypothetical protein